MYVAPPDGYVDVVVAARSRRLSIHVVGASAQTRPKPTDDIVFTVTARLRAGVAEIVTGTTARDLAGRAVDFDEVVRDASTLRDRVASAPVEDRARHLTRFLDARLEQDRSKKDDIETAERIVRGLERIGTDEGVTVSTLARILGTSERTLRRTVSRAVGLPPRTLLGLSRFRRALDLLRRTSASGAYIAATAGYIDQPHMIRDFRMRLGDSPERLRRTWLSSPPLVRPFVG